jgi:predicted ester cyclase/quercetin dioxygenase-like cupin family protein
MQQKEVRVERFSFASDVAFVPRGDLLDRVTVAPLTPSILEGSRMQAAIFRFEPGGRLRRHPATYAQILAVLEGSGEVSGAHAVDEPIEAGEAVFWHEGEEHETKSAAGLTALIIEGESLDRFRERPTTALRVDLSSRFRDHEHAMGTEASKQLVRRLVDEVVNQRNPDPLDELAQGDFAELARRWVSPFRSAFPDFTMEIVELVAENDTVVGHFKCSGTHRGEWLGVPPTGHRFEGVDEIYIFRVKDGKIASAIGVEDNLSRMRQLGIRKKELEAEA